MRTVHPKHAAERVTRLVSELADFLAVHGDLNRPPTDVSPQPCDQVDETVPLPSPADSGSSPFAAPWYVDYSPYTMMFIGYVDVRTAIGFAEVGGSLRDHASGLGWRIREAVLVPRHAKDEPRLVVESGTPGYGARIVDVPTASVPLRVGIFASSPCLRHPEARTDR